MGKVKQNKTGQGIMGKQGPSRGENAAMAVVEEEAQQQEEIVVGEKRGVSRRRCKIT